MADDSISAAEIIIAFTLPFGLAYAGAANRPRDLLRGPRALIRLNRPTSGVNAGS